MACPPTGVLDKLNVCDLLIGSLTFDFAESAEK